MRDHRPGSEFATLAADAGPASPSQTPSEDAELAYRRDLVEGQFRPVIAHWLIGVCLYDAFLANDYLVAPNDIVLYAIGRLGCVTPVTLLALAVAFRVRRLYEYAVCVPPLMMSASLSVLIVMTHGDYRANYLFGDVLLLMCGSVISRPRLPFAACTIAIQCVCFGFALFGSDVIPAGSVIVSLLFCFSGAVLALLATMSLEKASRAAFAMRTRVIMLNRELDAAATTDPLTGLANRRGLARATEALWAAKSGEQRSIGLILIDLDKFKSFNDSYGHMAGDLCLATVAKQVRASLRTEDALAVRFGGEELLVMLPGIGLAAAQSVAERIRLAIIEAAIPHPATAPDAVVTASLGVAVATTLECTWLELTARADTALYAAKSAGRNCTWPPPRREAA